MRRRKRRRLRLGAALWWLVAVNVVLALYFSPATAARKVRVRGVPEHDRARVRRDLQALLNRPWLAAPAREVESELMQSTFVREASLSRNVFGRATLTMRYRVPVARVLSSEGVFLSDEGRLFRAMGVGEGLPEVRVPAEVLRPTLAIAGTWPASYVAQVCRNASSIPLDSVVVEVDSSGGVCLNTGQSVRIVLGSAERADEKFAKLRELLAERPNLFSEITELNLTAPDRPMAVPRRRMDRK